MIKSKTGHIPAWVLNHLVSYGNCAIGRKLYKDLGKSLLPILLEEGFTVSSEKNFLRMISASFSQGLQEKTDHDDTTLRIRT